MLAVSPSEESRMSRCRAVALRSDAAAVDGASAWQKFRFITLPLLAPFTYIALTIRSLDVARAFDIVRIMTDGGPARRLAVAETSRGSRRVV